MESLQARLLALQQNHPTTKETLYYPENHCQSTSSNELHDLQIRLNALRLVQIETETPRNSVLENLQSNEAPSSLPQNDRESLSTSQPNFPTRLPTRLPTDFESDLPTPIQAKENHPERKLKRQASLGSHFFGSKGKKYDYAVERAQLGVRHERNNKIQEAIDEYGTAGKLLIDLGKSEEDDTIRQALKTKAFDLLTRAERLSEWSSDVRKNCKEWDVSEAEALHKALNALRKRADMESLEDGVNLLQVKEQNRKMKSEIISIKGRNQNDDSVSNNIDFVPKTPLERSSDDFVPKTPLERSSDDFVPKTSLERSSDDFVPEPRNSEKLERSEDTLRRSVVNELHELIGIPEINEFRKFRLLSKDAKKDSFTEKQSNELAAAKAEAEALKTELDQLRDVISQNNTLLSRTCTMNSSSTLSNCSSQDSKNRVQFAGPSFHQQSYQPNDHTRERLDAIKASLGRIQVPVMDLSSTVVTEQVEKERNSDAISQSAALSQSAAIRKSLGDLPKRESAEMQELDPRYSCSSIHQRQHRNNTIHNDGETNDNFKREGFFQKMAFWKSNRNDNTTSNTTSRGQSDDNNGVWI